MTTCDVVSTLIRDIRGSEKPTQSRRGHAQQRDPIVPTRSFLVSNVPVLLPYWLKHSRRRLLLLLVEVYWHPSHSEWQCVGPQKARKRVELLRPVQHQEYERELNNKQGLHKGLRETNFEVGGLRTSELCVCIVEFFLYTASLISGSTTGKSR